MNRNINKHDAFFLDRLLSGRDQLAPAERELIFANAVAQSQAQTAPSRLLGWRARLSLVASAAALAGLFIWLAPNTAERDNSFAHRGATADARLSLSCAHATALNRCQVGDKLMFQLNAPAQQPYFAAFARRADDVVIWYFPNQNSEHSIEVSANSEASVLQQGIFLGSEHSVGSYEVTAIFSTVPLTQAQIKQVITSDQLVPSEYTVVQRHFVVAEVTP